MALVWAWQCQCQWQRPPPPWQVSRDPPWCGPGLRESKFSFDSDATGGRRSNQRAVAPNQPTTPVTHQAPESTTSAFNFDFYLRAFAWLCVAPFHLLSCFPRKRAPGGWVCCVLPWTWPCQPCEKKKEREFFTVCLLAFCVFTVYLGISCSWPWQPKLSKNYFFFCTLFVCHLFVCLLSVFLSWYFPVLTLPVASASAEENRSGKTQLSVITVLLILFLFFLHICLMSFLAVFGISWSWPCQQRKAEVRKTTLRKVFQLWAELQFRFSSFLSL